MADQIVTQDGNTGLDASSSYLDLDENFVPTQEALSKREIGRAFYKLAKVHYDKADLDSAQEYFEKALACTDRPKDIFAIFKILGFLIRIASEKMENSKADEYIRECEQLVDELTSVLGSLNSEYFYNVGVVKNYRGLFYESRQNFELAYKKSKEENDPDTLAKTLLALANNCYNLKEHDLALNYLDQLDQLLKIINKSYLRGSMYMLLGRIYKELGLYDKSLESFSKSMVKLREKKCWNLYGYVLIGRGSVFKRLGEYEKSLLYFNMAKDLVDEKSFIRLSQLLDTEIQDVNDSSIDIYLDRTNRKVIEKTLGTIDFKHRFVLLEILFLLAKNSGNYYDKEQLAKSIWKDEYNPLIHDKLIYTSVSRLRKLIEPKNGKNEKRKYIVRGKDGYTFNPRAKIRFHLESKTEDDKSIANVDLNSPV